MSHSSPTLDTNVIKKGEDLCLTCSPLNKHALLKIVILFFSIYRYRITELHFKNLILKYCCSLVLRLYVYLFYSSRSLSPELFHCQSLFERTMSETCRFLGYPCQS